MGEILVFLSFVTDLSLDSNEARVTYLSFGFPVQVAKKLL